MLLNGLEWDEEVMMNVDVSQMRGQAVMASILDAIRAEKFCSGALKTFLEQGCREKWLTRLQDLKSTYNK